MSENTDILTLSQIMDGSETRSVNNEVIGDPNPLNGEQYYAITIKPTFNSYKKKVMINQELLLDVFNEVCKNRSYKKISHSIEYDSKGLYHLHGIFSSSDPFQAFNPTKKGWHIYVKFCYDYANWQSYITKDQPKKDYTFV